MGADYGVVRVALGTGLPKRAHHAEAMRIELFGKCQEKPPLLPQSSFQLQPVSFSSQLLEVAGLRHHDLPLAAADGQAGLCGIWSLSIWESGPCPRPHSLCPELGF